MLLEEIWDGRQTYFSYILGIKFALLRKLVDLEFLMCKLRTKLCWWKICIIFSIVLTSLGWTLCGAPTILLPPPHVTPVGSFWWKFILKLIPDFKAISSCSMGQGNYVLLLFDNWDGNRFIDRFPELHSFVVNDQFSIEQALHINPPEDLFHRPLSTQTFQQFQGSQNFMNNIQFSGSKDKWSYIWGSSQSSIAKVYKTLRVKPPTPPLFNLLWKSSVILWYKIFFWFLLHDRLNSRELLQRKSLWLPNYDCGMCDTKSLETAFHLFWNCPFSIQCWETSIPQILRNNSVYTYIQLAVPPPLLIWPWTS